MLKIINATENNLKNISVDIPKNKISSIIGPSGSGKSSLAINVIYNEANRKFLESLNIQGYNIKQIKKADVENIEGLSPSIIINSKNSISNYRATII